RLSRETFGYRFAHSIPPGISDAEVQIPSGRILRGNLVDEDDFVILWAGGYNTWTDVGTLFEALENLFKCNPKAKFVSFGGCIDGHDDVTYRRFYSLVENSKYRPQFILCGWKQREDVLRAYKESDIGLNIDSYHYELVFGTRTRLVEMIACGLPIITTVGSELSFIIKDNDLGLTFEIGDAKGMTEALLNFSRDIVHSREHYSKTALNYFKKHFTYAMTCEPLLKWIEKPHCAPDVDHSVRPVLMGDRVGVKEALLDLALEEVSAGRDAKAMKYLDAFTEMCPDHVYARYHLGSIRKRFGDIKGALECFEAAEGLIERSGAKEEAALSGGIHFHLGECLLAIEDKQQAVAHFKKCLSIIPGHGKATEYLSRLGE
ncbi:MAG: glycosyltransferase, partial [Candidatus Coatesbacteria bacterium]|nr:glycosyltransferase [Candidatus Coatesbacteria bacterium]